MQRIERVLGDSAAIFEGIPNCAFSLRNTQKLRGTREFHHLLTCSARVMSLPGLCAKNPSFRGGSDKNQIKSIIYNEDFPAAFKRREQKVNIIMVSDKNGCGVPQTAWRAMLAEGQGGLYFTYYLRSVALNGPDSKRPSEGGARVNA